MSMKTAGFLSVCLFLCVSGLTPTISHQTTGEISELCLPSFPRLRLNLIFTACLSLSLPHIKKSRRTTRLVHRAERHSLSPSLSLPPPPLLLPSTLNLTQGKPSWHKEQLSILQLRWSRLSGEQRGDAETADRASPQGAEIWVLASEEVNIFRKFKLIPKREERHPNATDTDTSQLHLESNTHTHSQWCVRLFLESGLQNIPPSLISLPSDSLCSALTLKTNHFRAFGQTDW